MIGTASYWNASFLEFWYILFYRICLFLSGKLSFSELASDEVQLIVLGSLSISSAVLGSFLVLRRMTMLANSLSHTILFGIVLAYLLVVKNGSSLMDVKTLILASVITAFLTTFLTQFFTKVLKLQEDASIGLVFSCLFALGIVLVTLFTKNIHIGTEVVMGNVDALHIDNIAWMLILLFVNVFLTILFYKQYHITTFDPSLAKTLGISVNFYSYLLMLQTSVMITGSFRAVGVLLVLAFLVLPPLIARLISHQLHSILVFSALFGFFASFLGVSISRHLLSVYGLPLSTSGLVVCVLAIEYFCLYFFMSLYRNTRRLLFSTLSKKV